MTAMSVSRRGFMGTSAMVTAASILPPWLAASLAAPIVRRDVSGTDPEARKAALAYREAVRVMKARPDHDPTSWVFQANIHSWPGWHGILAVPPVAEFERVFPSSGVEGLPRQEFDRRRGLAHKVWGTCPHSSSLPTITMSFLPWHRVYLFFFERIVRAAAGEAGINDPALGLPYWDWNKDRSLPAAFREAVDGSTANNALYWEVRNAGVNEGTVALLDPEVDLGAMQDTSFKPSFQGPTLVGLGFSLGLELTPHGSVHTVVGPTEGMGAFERAARDPIFWCHHCNIDRIWESWHSDPARSDPVDDSSWADELHTFVDADGQERTLTTAQVLATAVILDQGYTYDQPQPVPPSGPVPPMSLVATAGDGTQVLGSSSNVGPIQLGATPQRITIDPAEAAPSVPALAAEDAGRRILLSLQGLAAAASPGDNYGVYINLPPGEEPSPRSPYLAGVLNFFNVIGHPAGADAHAAAEGAEQAGLTQAFDITEILRRQQVEGLWRGGEVSVTIAPLRGRTNPDANPTVGRVQLVSP